MRFFKLENIIYVEIIGFSCVCGVFGCGGALGFGGVVFK